MKKNLTKEIIKACEFLNKNMEFNGIEILEASCKSYKDRLNDCLSDGMTKEEAEEYLSNYCSAIFDFNTYDLLSDEDNDGDIKMEFDKDKFIKDFTYFLVKYIGDKNCILGEVNINGRDTEFMRVLN